MRLELEWLRGRSELAQLDGGSSAPLYPWSASATAELPSPVVSSGGVARRLEPRAAKSDEVDPAVREAHPAFVPPFAPSLRRHSIAGGGARPNAAPGGESPS